VELVQLGESVKHLVYERDLLSGLQNLCVEHDLERRTVEPDGTEETLPDGADFDDSYQFRRRVDQVAHVSQDDGRRPGREQGDPPQPLRAETRSYVEEDVAS
jgi:hypothetical protein